MLLITWGRNIYFKWRLLSSDYHFNSRFVLFKMTSILRTSSQDENLNCTRSLIFHLSLILFLISYFYKIIIRPALGPAKNKYNIDFKYNLSLSLLICSLLQGTRDATKPGIHLGYLAPPGDFQPCRDAQFPLPGGWWWVLYKMRQNYPEFGGFHRFLSVSRVIWRASSIISSDFSLPFSQIAPKQSVGPCHSNKTIIKLIRSAGMGFLLMEPGAIPACKHQLCKKKLDGMQDAHPPKDDDGKMCSVKWMLGLYFPSLKK